MSRCQVCLGVSYRRGFQKVFSLGCWTSCNVPDRRWFRRRNRPANSHRTSSSVRSDQGSEFPGVGNCNGLCCLVSCCSNSASSLQSWQSVSPGLMAAPQSQCAIASTLSSRHSGQSVCMLGQFRDPHIVQTNLTIALLPPWTMLPRRFA